MDALAKSADLASGDCTSAAVSMSALVPRPKYDSPVQYTSIVLTALLIAHNFATVAKTSAA